MKIGGLYQVNEYYWLLCPSKDIADLAAYAYGYTVEAINASDYWSKHFNCNVSYIEPNNIFVLLEQDGEFCKILSNNGELGWIVYPENKEWINHYIEEVNK